MSHHFLLWYSKAMPFGPQCQKFFATKGVLRAEVSFLRRSFVLRDLVATAKWKSTAALWRWPTLPIYQFMFLTSVFIQATLVSLTLSSIVVSEMQAVDQLAIHGWRFRPRVLPDYWPVLLLSQVGYRAEVKGGELVRSCLCPVSVVNLLTGIILLLANKEAVCWDGNVGVGMMAGAKRKTHSGSEHHQQWRRLGWDDFVVAEWPCAPQFW